MSLIITLGEKRGEIYRNGQLSIEPELWDILTDSFDKLVKDQQEDISDEHG